MRETFQLFDRPRRSASLRLPGAGRLDGLSVNPSHLSGVNGSFVARPWAEMTTEDCLLCVVLGFRFRLWMSAVVICACV